MKPLTRHIVVYKAVVLFLPFLFSCSTGNDGYVGDYSEEEVIQMRADFDSLDRIEDEREILTMENVDTVLSILEQMMEFPTEVLTNKQVERQADKYITASAIYIFKNDVENAFSILAEGLDRYQGLAYKSSYFGLSQALTIMFFNYAMYDQANSYADYTIGAAKYLRDSTSFCLAYANKSWIADRVRGGNKDTAYKYVALARRWMPKSNPALEYITESYAGHIYVTDPDSARVGLRKLIACRDKFADVFSKAEGFSYMPYNIGRAYATLGDDRRAMEYFEEALEMSVNEPLMIRNEVLGGILPYYLEKEDFESASKIMPEWYETTRIRHKMITDYGMMYWNSRFRTERIDYELQLVKSDLEYTRFKELVLMVILILFVAAMVLMVYLVLRYRRKLSRLYEDRQRNYSRWKEVTASHVDTLSENERISQINDAIDLEHGVSEDEKKQSIMRTIYERVKVIMSRDMPYLDPDFSLTDLSRMAYCNRSQLSATINQYYGTNFSMMVSEYRVNYFLTLQENNKSAKIDDLWPKAGFPSRSSFFRQFQTITKLTPSQYVEQKAKHHDNQ